MILNVLTKTVRDAIAGNAIFSADAAAAIFEDYGNMKSKKSAALNLDDGEGGQKGPGYNIGVWPPARGNAEDQMAGIAKGEVVVVARFEVNPQVLPSDPTQAGQWFTNRLQAIMDSVLAIDPEVNRTRFQLAADAFELISFDEGLVCYHVRFVREVVFG